MRFNALTPCRPPVVVETLFTRSAILETLSAETFFDLRFAAAGFAALLCANGAASSLFAFRQRIFSLWLLIATASGLYRLGLALHIFAPQISA